MSRIPEQFWICFPYLYLHIYYNGNTRHLLDIAFDHLHLWWSIYRLESYFLKSNNWFYEKRCQAGSKVLSLDVSIVLNSIPISHLSISAKCFRNTGGNICHYLLFLLLQQIRLYSISIWFTKKFSLCKLSTLKSKTICSLITNNLLKKPLGSFFINC